MIDLVAWIMMLAPAIVTLVLIVELIAAQFPVRALPATPPSRVAIVIPAHDEATGVARMIADVRAVASGARLLVVADNCDDDTAGVARAAGAEVIERIDPDRRGKGYALAFARDHLAADPPDVVVLLDADCSIDAGGIARLAAATLASGRPVQSAYLMRPRPDLGAMVGLSGFAFLIRNLVRQRGLARIGSPALLTGSGMGLRWDVFAIAPLATADLVEDLAIGIALTRAGHPPAFEPGVTTWSDPARRGVALAQRTRWEQGFLRTAARQAWPLLAKGRWLGLHLLVPPLALLMLVDGIVLLLLAVLGACLPFALLAGLLLAATLMLALSWRRFGRAQISGGRLLLIPFYIVWKLPIYLGAMLRPERRWIRTRRD